MKPSQESKYLELSRAAWLIAPLLMRFDNAPIIGTLITACFDNGAAQVGSIKYKVAFLPFSHQQHVQWRQPDPRWNRLDEPDRMRQLWRDFTTLPPLESSPPGVLPSLLGRECQKCFGFKKNPFWNFLANSWRDIPPLERCDHTELVWLLSPRWSNFPMPPLSKR